jgi:hypothetical protein
MDHRLLQRLGCGRIGRNLRAGADDPWTFLLDVSAHPKRRMQRIERGG